MNLLLNKKFYEIINANPDLNDLNFTIRINPNHEIFDGHFPNQPVVPGVCMMEISKELFQSAIKRKVLLKHAAQTKFLQLLVPEANKHIDVTIQAKELDDNDSSNYQLNIIWKHDNQTIFKLMGKYELMLEKE